MGKITVRIEKTEHNYSAYIENLNGVVATGKTVDEIKKEIANALAFHLDGMREDGDEIPADFLGKYEIVYKFDTESLLRYYRGVFTNAALERLTGINQRQLQRYASGITSPKRVQIEKIETALHELGKELIAVEL
jgi:predicted RNase H-like HicB family nuclease